MSFERILFSTALEKAVDEIRALGGRVTHLFAPAALVAIFPDDARLETLTQASWREPADLPADVQALVNGWHRMRDEARYAKPAPSPRKEVCPCGGGCAPDATGIEPAETSQDLPVWEALDGLPWDHQGRAHPLAYAQADTPDDAVLSEQEGQPDPEPTPLRHQPMTEKVAVGVVMVNSTRADCSMTEAETANALTKILAGTDFLAKADPKIDLSFAVAHTYVTSKENPGALTLWQVKLSKGSEAVTWVANDGDYDYLGCNGYVYRLDQKSGKELSINDLQGAGFYETRICVAPAGLLVGINGSVVLLSRPDLKKVWSTSLPGCGFAATSVLAMGDNLFAGCNGFVYRLSPAKGTVAVKNTLDGVGKGPMSLVCEGAGMPLYVGVNGYVVSLNQETLKETWRLELPKCGKGVVNVAVGNGHLYASCNGYVFRLRPEKAETIFEEKMDFGTAEIRLSLGPLNLWAGVKGYALALNRATCKVTETISLPDCGDAATAVLAHPLGVYAGAGGYVYRIDPVHLTLDYTNPLKGVGKGEVRLAASPTGILAGVNGYAATTSNASKIDTYERAWMQSALTGLGYKTVQEYNGFLMKKFNATKAFTAFVTQYPLAADGYSRGDYIVMNYRSQWGPANLQSVFVHETCHLFGAADEYGNCECNTRHGVANVANGNCVNCKGGSQEPCVMARNALALCQWTRGQIGWDYCHQLWSQSLKDCGFETTSVLITDDSYYAGSNGHVYRLDKFNGTQDAHNELKGLGNYEVTLAEGATKIVAGVNGTLVGLDKQHLTKDWTCTLTEAGSGKTVVLGTARGEMFAGCNGYVYKVNAATGAKLAVSEGLGSHAVQLAADDGIVYAGVNGVVYALSDDTLTKKWSRTLPDRGNGGATSIVVHGNYLFAACNGYVHRLKLKDGYVSDTNALEGYGNYPISLAVRFDPLDKVVIGVYVGMNGMVFCMDPFLNVSRKTELPDCGKGLTNVTVLSGYVFAGCNGYLFKLSDDVVTWINPMKGLGVGEVRMAGRDQMILAGLKGNAIANSLVLPYSSII